ncbi:MAG: four helix bundle protein [Planctomycetales bacterium]|nr:four helix bundle protein [Planctomycetales bacterium]
MKDYKKIRAWQKSHELVKQVYALTEKFPSKEMYGLTSQLRRAAVSIPTNIAEGYGRTTDTEIARFLDIALGSVNEVDYLLFLSLELKYIKDKVENLEEKVVEIRKMLTAFVKTLRGTVQKADS